MSIEEFQLTEKTGKMIFAIFMTSTTELRDIYMVFNSTEIVDIQLSKEYEDYVDVFSKAEISKFPESICMEYMIPVKKDKKVSFGPIYRLSENEL